jgi:hypothetical protein
MATTLLFLNFSIDASIRSARNIGPEAHPSARGIRQGGWTFNISDISRQPLIFIKTSGVRRAKA